MTVTFDYKIIFEKEIQSLSVCYILTVAINKKTQTTLLIGIFGKTDDISRFHRVCRIQSTLCKESMLGEWKAMKSLDLYTQQNVLLLSILGNHAIWIVI